MASISTLPITTPGNSSKQYCPTNISNLNKTIPNHGSTSKRNALNPAIIKNKKWTFFQCLNNARIFWDPKAKPKGLLGGHLNICSLLPKNDQIKHLLLESNIDYLFLSETWLHSNSPSAALSVPGYNIFRKDRSEGKAGGVLFYVKDHIHCTQIDWVSENDLECIGLKVTLSPQMSFTLIGLYRPPKTKVVFFDQLKAILNECDLKVEGSTYVNDWGGSWQFPMSVSVRRLQRALWLRRTVIDASTARLHLRNIQSSPNRQTA